MNPFLSGWFAGSSLAGMGLAAWLGHRGFRRLARRYGAEDLRPPPGVLRALFRVLLALWAYLIGSMLASLAWRLWPPWADLPGGAHAAMGGLGALAALYYLTRDY